MKQVLLAEDDAKLSSLLAESLASEDFHLKVISTPEALKQELESKALFQLIILDRLLGAIDTRDLVPTIKTIWPNTPLMIISAINTPTERADLINQGADDYLGKPFLTVEFIARLKSLARRSAQPVTELRRIGGATLNLGSRQLQAGQLLETLPAKEFQILSALSERPGKVFSRYDLLEKVWGNINHAENNLVEATILNLRKRLSQLNCGVTIKNQRNAGYWLEG